MTLERATEFGSAWNSRDPDLVASFFADDGVYHASVGPDRLGKAYLGKEEIRKGVKAFFERFPDGRFENLKVVVSGDFFGGRSSTRDACEQAKPYRCRCGLCLEDLFR